MKKLNNKGFTLIELLAVIVILAIVMGVAANAVLNVMNDSRRNTLQSSAKSAADSFRTAYAEYQLTRSDKILGITSTDLIKSTATSVALTDAATSLGITNSNYDLAKSYVYFDPSTSTFAVCLVANPSGSYYLASAVGKSMTAADSPVGQALAATDMWACSNDEHSWT